jgi:hypothetical protein
LLSTPIHPRWDISIDIIIIIIQAKDLPSNIHVTATTE